MQLTQRPFILIGTLLLGCAAISLASMRPPQPADAQSSTTITLSPSPAAISGCDTVTASVMINNVAGLYGADVRLAFDPNMLEVVDANGVQSGIQSTPGGILSGSLFTVYNTADNSLGTIKYAATQISPTLPFTGTGPLLKIMFRAKVSGTSNITFTFTQLADRNGNTISAVATNGSTTNTSPASPALSISKLNSTDAQLSWTSIASTAVYSLYRGTAPYFTPADPPFVSTASNSYSDLGALGNTSTNYFYVINSVCANGFTSGNSNRVGEFDFPILRDKSNAVALPLIDTSLTNADSLGIMISATVVSRWNAAIQGFGSRTVGISGINFTLATGNGYFINTPGTGPTVFTTVGGVPDPGSISFALTRAATCKLNLISLPLDQSSILNADGLANSIGGVPTISVWQAAFNTFGTRTVGLSGPNFTTKIGYPYWPCANTSGGNPIWP